MLTLYCIALPEWVNLWFLIFDTWAQWHASLSVTIW